jgi:hypothetical protein
MKLQAIHSSQKSFYNKATLVVEGKETKLKSYDTIVAIKKDNSIKVNGYYSKTTAIHINEFLRQNGLQSLNKKQMELEPTLTIQ